MGRFRDRFFVRYAEVDQQGVVFNAHYMTYCDTAVDRWWRSRALEFGDHGYDVMVVKAVIEWEGSAKYAEELEVEVHASRWGNTSFDVRCVGTVAERSIFTATLTYVGVKHGTTETTPVPEQIKAALSEPS